MKRSFILTAFSFLVLVQLSLAQVPQTISYQGVLRDAATDAPLEGAHSITFSLYDAATAATPAWSENQTVTITDGVFSVVLGQETANVLPYPFTSPAWLGIKVGADAELPRIELTSVPYALQAGELNMPATERWYSIPGIEFNAASGNYYIGSYVYKSNANDLFAPVHLPHGATVTGFEAYFYDVDSVNANIDLYRYYEITPDIMASATTTSLSTYGTVSDNTIDYANIDNQYYTYLVRASWNTPTSSNNIRLYNVRIKYTVDQLLP